VQAQHLPLSEVEQVAVGVGSDAGGKVKVGQAVSPVFTPEQEEEVRKARSLDAARK
jgi:hypothetical protein